MKNLSNAGNHNRILKPFSRNAKRFTFLIILLILLVSPLATVAQAQTNNSQQKKENKSSSNRSGLSIFFPFNLKVFAQGRNATPTPTPKAVRQNARGNQQPNIFQRIWQLVTAPFNALVNLVTTQAPRRSPSPAPKAVAPSPLPSPVAEVTTDTTTAATNVETPVATGGLTVTSLGAGTKYVDLIGKTIIDSSGNIYPSNDGLAQSTKPSLGISTNKFYGLILNNLEVSSGGFLITKDKVTLGDESGDTIKFVGRIGTDIVPSGNDEITLGKSGNAFKQSFITTVSSSTVDTDTLNVTTVKLQDGTASSPGLQFASDTDSGLWRIGANQIALTTAGASHFGLTINSSGNLGIGNTSASARFQVNSGASSTVITSAGNVGIGTTTANSLLSVAGGAHIGSLRQGIVAPTDGLFVDGNVGVGATSTAYNLDIWGTGRFTGALTVAGNLGIGTSLTVDSAAALTTLNVTGISNLVGNVGVGTSLNVSSASILDSLSVTKSISTATLGTTGNVAIGSSLTVSSGTSLSSSLSVSGHSSLTTLSTTGATTLGGTLTFSGVGLDITTGSNEALTIIPGGTGNVGIGYSSPYGRLFVLGAGTGTGINFQTVSSTQVQGLTVLDNGNVGIGTTLPAFNLQVIATGNFGNIGVGGSLVTSGNVGVGQSLSVTSAAALSTLNVTGISNLVGNVGIGTSLNIAGLGYAQGGLRVNGFSDLTGNVGIGGSLTVTSLSRFSSSILGILGSATAPAFSFISDTDTGLFSPSANALGFTTNSASRFTITEAGFLGIGITSPSQTFQVNSGASSTVITSAGNVGIGTTTANSLLSVAGGVNIGTGSQGVTAPTNGLFVGGNVGIGFTSPARALDVNSTIIRFRNNTSAPTLAFDGDFAIGNIGTGLSSEGRAWVRSAGTTFRFDSASNTADYSEYFYQGDVGMESGDVVVADKQISPIPGTGRVNKSSQPYQGALMGVVTIVGRGTGHNNPNDDRQFDPKFANVGLLGHVEVKVNKENGAIKPGDFLTSSSQAGVAMKATKAGPIIGQALAGFDGPGVGRVMAFVKAAYYNGGSLSDLLITPESGSLEVISGMTSNLVDFSQRVLETLINQLKNSQSNQATDLVLDRVAAAAEIVTPKLTADEVILGQLKPLKGQNLLLGLEDNQSIVIKTKDQESIRFDSNGNAYFKGQIVAGAVKADSIEGLRVLTDNLITSQISSATPSAQVASVDMTTLVKLNQGGGITIAGKSEFKETSIFQSLVEFVANVIFRGDVRILGRAIFGRDMAGSAVVKAGSDQVDVVFGRAYDQTPSINVTAALGSVEAGPILSGELRYVVINPSTNGFSIKLNKPASADLRFSWTAIASSDATTSVSTSVVAPQPTPSPSPEAIPSPSPQPSVTPQPTTQPASSEATSSASLTSTP